MKPFPAVREAFCPVPQRATPARAAGSGCRPGADSGMLGNEGLRATSAARREGNPMADSVLHEVDGAVATITINRPAARNALTAETKVALLEALQDADRNAAVRAVVLTGAGQAFCSGQDLREHAELLAAGGTPLDTVRLHYNPIIDTIAGMPKPVVAALPGVAAGAGASLAFACDFRIAAERASLLLAFARVGLGADSGASWTLQRLIGAARAAEMLMLAEPIGSAAALSLGLLTSVVPDDELPAAAAAFAARLAEGPTLAYAAIKESLLYASTHSLTESLDKEADLQERLGASSDHQAATQAFVRKETPAYQGR
jgi:2-(1,2-epoxy-1,2-dihydrophenyl)acetyl-CoA isomerase